MPPATTTTPAPPDNLPAALRGFQEALADGRADDADARLRPLLQHRDLPAAALDPAVRQLAQHWLNQQQWQRADEGFALLHAPQPSDTMQRNLARNFAQLRQHRPALCDLLLAPRPAEATPRYRVTRGDDGRNLIAQRTTAPDAQPPQYTITAPGQQWPDFLTHLRKSTADGPDQPVVLLSIGDGYALGHLAENPPALFMDQQLPVHIVEPDLDRLMLALHVHDWSADAGPIRDPRFRWYVGPAWEAAVARAWEDDPWTPQPAMAVCPDPAQAAPLGEAIRRLTDDFQEHVGAQLAQVKQRYARKHRDELVALLGTNPPRKPRLLLMTSRFTTVLQYATADTADAFEQLGWDTLTLCERRAHERFNSAVFARAMLDFEPDVLLSIDATRHRFDGQVPDSIPYLCWIQDALPRLMTDTLGRAIALRDFVLSFFSPRLVGDHAYPARQCIDMPMMVTADKTADENTGKTTGITRRNTAGNTGAAGAAGPDHPAASADAAVPLHQRTGPDLLYASNVSATPAGLLDAALARAPRELHPFVTTAGEAIIAHYNAGDALPTEPDIDALLETLVTSGVLPPHNAPGRRALLDALWNPLNTGLYRQQALRWITDTTEQHGLTLHLHGQGWEQNPQFAAYARGPLDHGALQRATAQAKFALHLEPYICFSHHRMLDATLAGTPVLVRDHPGNTGLQTVAAFLAQHAPEAAHDADARAAVAAAATTTGNAAVVHELESLLRRYRVLTWDLAGDVVAQVRCWQRAGVLPDVTGQTPALPHLEALTFHDAESFRERFLALRDDPTRVCDILEAQQRAIRQRLTFPAAFARVIGRVRDLIADEPA